MMLLIDIVESVQIKCKQDDRELLALCISSPHRKVSTRAVLKTSTIPQKHTNPNLFVLVELKYVIKP